MRLGSALQAQTISTLFCNAWALALWVSNSDHKESSKVASAFSPAFSSFSVKGSEHFMCRLAPFQRWVWSIILIVFLFFFLLLFLWYYRLNLELIHVRKALYYSPLYSFNASVLFIRVCLFVCLRQGFSGYLWLSRPRTQRSTCLCFLSAGIKNCVPPPLATHFLISRIFLHFMHHILPCHFILF